MQITLTLNDKKLTADVAPDTLLIDFVRSHGCLSVKRGCETSNCGLCTVFLDDKPVLSCSVLAARADGALGLLGGAAVVAGAAGGLLGAGAGARLLRLRRCCRSGGSQTLL